LPRPGAGLTALTEPLKRALDHALETVRWVAGFGFPITCATRTCWR
jgi:hypothetical protein